MRKSFVVLLVLFISFVSSGSFAPTPVDKQNIDFLRSKSVELKSLYESLETSLEYLQTFSKFEKASPLHLDSDDGENELTYWHLQGPNQKKHFEGIDVESLQQVALTKKGSPVLYAVLDGGVNINHEAIKDYVFTNTRETLNGLDDDGNGLIDDVHGWDYVGQNVGSDSMELTREFVRCSKLSQKDSYCSDMIAVYTYQKAQVEKTVADLDATIARVEEVQKQIKQMIGDETYQGNIELISVIENYFYAKDEKFGTYFTTYYVPPTRAKGLRNFIHGFLDYYDTSAKKVEKQTQGYDGTLTDTVYGNNLPIGPDPSHGTHVAHTVIKVFETALGEKLAKKYLRLLPVRVVPDGDERDIDVANAINYAVSMGARIIQMSFGKDYSSLGGKELVDAAVANGLAKGVIFVHSAGNDGRVISANDNFPNGYHKKEKTFFTNWVEIGNSTHTAKFEDSENPYRIQSIAATSSNFGSMVDIFAPGSEVYAAYSEKAEETTRYKFLTGTSMASPVFSGVLAVMLYQYGYLDPVKLKDAIIGAARKTQSDAPVVFWERLHHGSYGKNFELLIEGEDYKRVDMHFGETSKSGGLLDAHQAVCSVMELEGC
ncbi:MAG: S8 family serine peptidase [Bdellovibrionales bacterium]|nr:S8 family serine peptidase [Bdellovibrionales bacterium]